MGVERRAPCFHGTRATGCGSAARASAQLFRRPHRPDAPSGHAVLLAASERCPPRCACAPPSGAHARVLLRSGGGAASSAEGEPPFPTRLRRADRDCVSGAACTVVAFAPVFDVRVYAACAWRCDLGTRRPPACGLARERDETSRRGRRTTTPGRVIKTTHHACHRREKCLVFRRFRNPSWARHQRRPADKFLRVSSLDLETRISISGG
jgi:hypothetical protein